ncbi:MAG: DsbA family protein, partial [Parvibaculum sp.]
MNQNRVIAIAVAAVLAVTALGYLGYRTFGSKDVLATSDQDDLSKIVKELSVPGPLGDMSMGNPDAPIKVYE